MIWLIVIFYFGDVIIIETGRLPLIEFEFSLDTELVLVDGYEFLHKSRDRILLAEMMLVGCSEHALDLFVLLFYLGCHI